MFRNRKTNAQRLKLSPLARLYFEFNIELGFVNNYLDEGRYDKLIKMYHLAEQRRDTMIRNMLLLDAIALLLIFGKAINIPGLNFSLAELPAARELVTFLAASTFLFMTFSFVNVQGYAALIDVINSHRARGTGFDPDYLTAADRQFEFTPKLYRPKMSLVAPELLKSSRAFRLTSFMVIAVLFLTLLAILAVHLIVAGISIRSTFSSEASAWLKYAMAFAIALPNLGGLMMLLTFNRAFSFEILPVSNQQPQAIPPTNSDEYQSDAQRDNGK